MRTALAVAASLATVVSPACKRNAEPKPCSKERLEEFTPSVGTVRRRTHGVRQGSVEHDIWTGTIPCGPQPTDRNFACEIRAREEAQRHFPKTGGEIALLPGKTGDPEKWKGDYSMPVAMPAMPEHDLGLFPSATECTSRLDAIPRQTYGGGSCAPAGGGLWRGSYKSAMTAADFARMGPTSPPTEVGTYESKEECERKTRFLAPTGAAISCRAAGSWAYEARAFVREAAGPIRATVTLDWWPTRTLPFSEALRTLDAEAHAIGAEVLSDPAPTDEHVTLGCR